MKKSFITLLTIALLIGALPPTAMAVTHSDLDIPLVTETAPAEVVTLDTAAHYNSDPVLVNGIQQSLEVYTINQNNYFKLRDLATLANGTNQQFEVTWDQDKGAIHLISGQSYTLQGGELVPGDGSDKTAVDNTSPIYLDGQLVELTAYTINQNNYFKLRDVCRIFDIGVTWAQETNTVGIDTSIPYSE